MATATQRPHKRFRRCTTGDVPTASTWLTTDWPRARSASTPTYTTRRNGGLSTFPSQSRSRSRARSAADARALVLDPAYTGLDGSRSPRVIVDAMGIEHDPDFRMFPAPPPKRRRASPSSAVSPFAGIAGYSRSTASHCDFDSEDELELDDSDSDAESAIEWSRVHAQESARSDADQDSYADFDGMEWDESEWRREEVRPAFPAPESSKSKLAPTPFSFSRSLSSASLSKSSTSTSTTRQLKSGSVSLAARGPGCVSARGRGEALSCGYRVRRHWQSTLLYIRLSIFRWRRRLHRVIASAAAGTGADE
ncbi:hypothetical protein CTheo_3421 [Ceratobasidium theobromae]|uniref:Uncharacterized protein n=1 Tax=Ceratobasidium theobromae TaxID=1582974 RepID=A0A5N5QN93_9AGAM|nr:hypothetical protein CTheo_3421 [Ceratobasidium theobromae]